jgi:hypothetical protein
LAKQKKGTRPSGRNKDLRGASNSVAGLISGMFFDGYMAAVPVLRGPTDRIDAPR